MHRLTFLLKSAFDVTHYISTGMVWIFQPIAKNVLQDDVVSSVKITSATPNLTVLRFYLKFLMHQNMETDTCLTADEHSNT